MEQHIHVFKSFDSTSKEHPVSYINSLIKDIEQLIVPYSSDEFKYAYQGIVLSKTNDRLPNINQIEDCIFQMINACVMKMQYMNPYFNCSSSSGYQYCKFSIGDFYYLHTDYHDVCPSAYTVLINLSDEKDYEGGEIDMQLNGQSIFTGKLSKYDILLFPSHPMCVYQIKPITYGSMSLIRTVLI